MDPGQAPNPGQLFLFEKMLKLTNSIFLLYLFMDGVVSYSTTPFYGSI